MRNPDLENRFLLALAGYDQIELKPMFRGATIMFKGQMLVAINEKTVMVRVNPAAHDWYLEHAQPCTSMMMKGKVYKGYLEVPVSVFGDQIKIDFWLDHALQELARIGPKKAKQAAKSSSN